MSSLADLETTAIQETEALEVYKGNEVPEQRVRAALSLKIAGAPYSAIAEQLGFANALAARNVVERYLASMVSEGDVRSQRNLMSERLERLLRAVWPKALQETIEVEVSGKGDTKKRVTVINEKQLEYVRTSMMLVDRMARLHGLDAPQRVEITRASDSEVVEWAHRMAESAGMLGAREAEDIMEAEVVALDSEDE